jgi:hypothetical protein
MYRSAALAMIRYYDIFMIKCTLCVTRSEMDKTLSHRFMLTVFKMVSLSQESNSSDIRKLHIQIQLLKFKSLIMYTYML